MKRTGILIVAISAGALLALVLFLIVGTSAAKRSRRVEPPADQINAGSLDVTGQRDSSKPAGTGIGKSGEGVKVLSEESLNLLPDSAEATSSAAGKDSAAVVRPVTIPGRAFDNESGAGVADVVLTWGESASEAVSDASGFFTLVVPVKGEEPARITASPPPGWVVLNADPEGLAPVEIPADENETRLYVALAKAAPLKGVVLQPDGVTPTEGATVTVTAVRADSSRLITPVSSHSTVTDERGVFQTSLYPDAGNRIEARSGDLSAVDSIFADNSLEPKDIILILERTASVAGRVTAPTGDAAPGVTVLVATTGTKGETSTTTAVTDENGIYEARNVPPGDLEISASVPINSGYFSPEPIRLEIAEGQTRKDVDLVLSEGDVIEGYVFNRDEEPVEAATITGPETLRLGPNPWSPRFQPGWLDQESLQTDINGYFRITGIPPGQPLRELTVSHPDYVPETRRNVTMLDGLQHFHLTKDSSVTLTVLWKEDRTPVTYYAYRLLRPGWNDFQYETGHHAIDVFTETGSTEISDIRPGKYTAEVTVLGPDGSLSELRDSLQFEIAAGGETQELELLMSGGFFVTGTVVRMPEDASVGGVNVRFIPPSTDWRQPVVSSPGRFHFASTATNGSGFFEFAGVPPGRYTLVAETEELRMKVAHDFTVETTPPPPQRLEVWPGGVILGYVTSPDGEPLSRATILHQEHAPNMDRWVMDQRSTDADGFYSFVGVQSGVHFVTAMDDALDLSDRKKVEVKPGEEVRLDFDFSEGVTLTGIVRVNGQPPGSRPISVYLAGADGSFSDVFHVEPDGRYAARVRPGVYNVLVQSGSVQGEGQEVTVAATPSIQTRDIEIEIVSADIVIEYPEGTEFQPGHVVVAPRDMKAMYRYIRYQAYQENRHVPEMLGGEYIATFTSLDEDWQGDSDWVTLQPGGENLFHIEVERIPRSSRIGGWLKNELTLDFESYAYDASRFVDGAGTYEVVVNYERGRHAAVIDSVTLLQNGRPVARDTHHGWSGFDKIGTTYSLPLNEAPPNAIYTVEVTMRSDGGTDSEGSVYLRVR